MNNLLLLANIVNDDPSVDGTKFIEVMRNLIPILGIATAIITTAGLVIKVVSANFQSATGDQGKYEQAKRARKRALIAGISGLLWPVIFMIAGPIAGAIAHAIDPQIVLPPLWF